MNARRLPTHQKASEPARVTTEGRSFGAVLRSYRTEVGLTQEGLAERAGLSRRGIADLERGARLTPHAHTVERLADALDLSDAERGALIAAGRAHFARARTAAATRGEPAVIVLDDLHDQRAAQALQARDLKARAERAAELSEQLAKTNGAAHLDSALHYADLAPAQRARSTMRLSSANSSIT
jgi:transcriptional regulator with XRE-family HTH domain